MSNNQETDPTLANESWEPSDILEVMLFIQMIIKNMEGRKNSKEYSVNDVSQLHEENMRLKAQLSLLDDLMNKKFK